MNGGESRQFTHNSSLSIVHSLAFTLAETLIVMGIIGVVAALTIPNVNKNTGRAEAVAKVKKIYAELNEAHNRATAVYGPLKTWFVNDNNYEQYSKRYFDRLTEFLKVSKNCRDNSDCIIDCFAVGFNNNLETCSGDNPAALLNNNVSFVIIIDNKTGYYIEWIKKPIFGHIGIDIDGPNQGKNMLGIDRFHFMITADGILPSGSAGAWNDEDLKEYCFTQISVDAKIDCTAWVINTGNMDYLDASHEESTAGKCKNGKQLSTTISSCK